MNLEDIRQLVSGDVQMDKTELDLESLKTPQLHNKYMKHLTNFKLLLSRAEAELATTKKGLWEYYTGKAAPEVYKENPFQFKLLRQDVDQYIQSDEEFIRLKHKVDYLNTVVDFLDRTLRQITSRSFLIKDAIDWRKFTSGAV